MLSRQKYFFKLIIITAALFMGAIVYTYGKNDTPVIGNTLQLVKHFQGFKPIAYPDLNPADVVAATNIRLHTA
jgi:hypothetical protein